MTVKSLVKGMSLVMEGGFMSITVTIWSYDGVLSFGRLFFFLFIRGGGWWWESRVDKKTEYLFGNNSFKIIS